MADVDLREGSVADLVQRLSEQTTTLVRQEMRLMQAELQEKGKRAGIGAGLLGAAGIVGLAGFGALVAAMILALGEAVAMWISAFIVTGVLLVVAGVMALLGRKQVAAAVPPKPEVALESIKADVTEIKEAAQR
jgi:MFS family permease